MNNPPSVTIAIPTYNRANSFLGQSLACAIGQTYADIEIIVSDNCSTDNTAALVEGFSDSRIRYFRHEINLGAARNIEFCLGQARGDYFLLLMDDDLIDPTFVETCMQAAAHDVGAGIIRTGTRVIDQNGNVLSEAPNRDKGFSTEEFIRRWFRWESALYLCSTLFKTENLKAAGGFKSKHNHWCDVLVELTLALRHGRVDIEEVKASFRIHEGARTFTAKFREWTEDSIQLLDFICAHFPESRLLRNEGLKYFSKFNFDLAKKLRSPWERLLAYLDLTKTYKLVFLRQAWSRRIYP